MKYERIVIVDPHTKSIGAYMAPKGTKVVWDKYGKPHFIPPKESKN